MTGAMQDMPPLETGTARAGRGRKVRALQDWREANRRYLMASLGLVREALQHHAARGEGAGPSEALERAPETDAARLPVPPALETLCGQFGLSPFERSVLLMCAGVELDAGFPALCAAAQGDAGRGYPTFSLALAALPGAHWSALVPSAPLRRWRLIELGAGDKVTLKPLRIDERILHHLAGLSHLDERLEGLLEPLGAPGELPGSHIAVARRMAQVWSLGGAEAWPVIHLCGGEHAAKLAIAAAACTKLGLPLYALRSGDIPGVPAEREALARLWERESILSGAALVVDGDEQESAEAARPALSFLERTRGRLILSTREPLDARRRLVIRLDVEMPSSAEQRMLWQRALGGHAGRLDGELDTVVAQFNLSLEGICAAGAGALAGLASGERAAGGGLLWESCRVQARPRMGDLARRIEPAAGWDELVLPAPQLETLREIAAHVRQRAKVYESWGFTAKGKRGLGISALFAGASGTGKTMAAEVLAGELRLDLYHIDLSQVVSKYIGETEKNLRRVFDAAEEGGAILLFDEADALFGKRSEVKDSHDRYANVEISYLLQRMEAYRGVAILTTNMKSALDPAFMRRIRFVVQFPFPDASQRAEIWGRIFPAETPTDGIDIGKLARLNVAGGSIRNIALNAAFLAAQAGEAVRMTHLLRAARSEYAKLERPVTEAEIGGWA